MAFVLEDGTGVTDANALVSVAELDAYLTDRNIASYDYIATEKQAAIIIASTDKINTFYQFKGYPLSETQGMQIPTDEVSLNAQIKRAACEAAYLHLIGRLFVSPADNISTGRVKRQMDKLDVLETEVEYHENSGYTSSYPTPGIDRLLHPYVIAGGLGRTYRW